MQTSDDLGEIPDPYNTKDDSNLSFLSNNLVVLYFSTVESIWLKYGEKIPLFPFGAPIFPVRNGAKLKNTGPRERKIESKKQKGDKSLKNVGQFMMNKKLEKTIIPKAKVSTHIQKYIKH